MDNLKAINDSHGHHEGDRALVATAELLVATFRSSDLVARFGGDEFVVLTFGKAMEPAETSVARFRSLSQQHNEDSATPYRFRASVGWAAVDTGQPRALEAAAAEADRQMYRDNL